MRYTPDLFYKLKKGELTRSQVKSIVYLSCFTYDRLAKELDTSNTHITRYFKEELSMKKEQYMFDLLSAHIEKCNSITGTQRATILTDGLEYLSIMNQLDIVKYEVEKNTGQNQVAHYLTGYSNPRLNKKLDLITFINKINPYNLQISPLTQQLDALS
jgi:hypothetical protein